MSIENIVDLTVEYTRFGKDMKNVIKKMYMKEYNKKGDQGIIDQFKKFTGGNEIFLVRNGRYSFTPQITPQNYTPTTMRENN